MNKSAFLVLFLFMATLAAKADIAPTVMLHHAGKTTMFAWDKVQDAVDASVNGDTIYLTEGSFAPFNVNKRIMVRGAGYNTMIEGTIEIDISGTTAISMPVLDAMSLREDVLVKSAYKQFTLRKVKAQNLRFYDIEFRDIKLDRCHFFGYLWLRNKIKEFNAFNCKIQQLAPEDYLSGKATFEHCNIYKITDTITATFSSCVMAYARVKRGNNYYACILGGVLDNCLFYYYNGRFVLWNSATVVLNCTDDKTSKCNSLSFSSNSYISSIDNTMIGCYGGQHPFTQWPELPAVKKHNIKVDAANKKLNVILTVEKY